MLVVAALEGGKHPAVPRPYQTVERHLRLAETNFIPDITQSRCSSYETLFVSYANLTPCISVYVWIENVINLINSFESHLNHTMHYCFMH